MRGCGFDTLSNEFLRSRSGHFHLIPVARPRKPTRFNGRFQNTFICPLESFSKNKNGQNQWKAVRSCVQDHKAGANLSTKTPEPLYWQVLRAILFYRRRISRSWLPASATPVRLHDPFKWYFLFMVIFPHFFQCQSNRSLLYWIHFNFCCLMKCIIEFYHQMPFVPFYNFFWCCLWEKYA